MGHHRNILTLQFGHYANLIGTHFWNLQDEAAGLTETEDFEALQDIDTSTLFYEVRKRNVSSFRPRTVIFDVRGSLGAFNNELIDEEAEAEANVWGGSVDIFKAPKIGLHPIARDLGWGEGASGDILRVNPAWAEEEEEEEEDPDVRVASDDEDEELGGLTPSGDASEDAAKQTKKEKVAVKDTTTTDDGGVAERGVKRRRFFFTDFLQAEIPAKSVVQLSTPFADVPSFFTGRSQSLSWSEREAIEDAIRFQLEQSDRLESVQAVWDVYSPLSAHVKTTLLMVSEEAPKASCLFVPAAHPDSYCPKSLPALREAEGLDAAVDKALAAKAEELRAQGDEEGAQAVLAAGAADEDEGRKVVQRERAAKLRAAGASLSLVEALECDLEHMVAPLDASTWHTQRFNAGWGQTEQSKLALDDFSAAGLAAVALDHMSLPARLHAGGSQGGFNGLNRLVSAPHETMVGVSIALPMPKGIPKKKKFTEPPANLTKRERALFAAAMETAEKEDPLYWRELCGVPKGVEEVLHHTHQYLTARVDSFDTMGRVIGLVPEAANKSMWMMGCELPLPVSYPKHAASNGMLHDSRVSTTTAVRVHNARAGGGNVFVREWCEQFTSLRTRPDWAEVAQASGLESDDWVSFRHQMMEHDFFGVEEEDSVWGSSGSDSDY